MGPFSLRQLIILAVGFGISYALFTISARLYEINVLEYFIIALPALIALMAAVVKVRNVTFTRFILLSLEYAINPKKRYWDHRAVASTTDPDLNSPGKSKAKEAILPKNVKNINLRELSLTLDSAGGQTEIEHEDLDQVSDEDLITQAYFGHRREEGSVHNMYWRTRTVQKEKLSLLAKLPKVKVNSLQLKQEPSSQPSPPQSAMPQPETEPPVVKVEVAPPKEEKKPEILVKSPLPEGPSYQISNSKIQKKEVTEAPDKSNELKVIKKENFAEPKALVPVSPQKEESTAKALKEDIEVVSPPLAAKPLESQVTASPSASDSQGLNPVMDSPWPKKKRRKRKNKVSAGPVRQETQINTLQKSVPDKVLPKATFVPTEVTTSLQDLKEGEEIEFNLN